MLKEADCRATVLRVPTIHHAISLGLECRAAYQLRRVFRACSPSGVFDWQITPAAALTTYIENDLRGMFDLSDLYIDEQNIVSHRVLGTRHQHEFPEDVTEETLPLLYPRARQRHDYLCEKFRRLVRGTQPILFAVCAHRRVEAQADMPAIIELIRRRNPSRSHYFLVEPAGGQIGPNWMGNDEVWNAALRPYSVPVSAKIRARLALYARPRVATLPRVLKRAL